MTITLSIDAGLHGLGCGLFYDKELATAWYASPGGKGRGPARWREVIKAGLGPLMETGITPDTVVMETMQIYAQRDWKGDPADVLEVQGVCGAISAWAPFAAATLVGYTPREWKGLVPQQVYSDRVDSMLARRGWNDSRIVPHPSNRHHDVMHGIGVGLHHLGIKTSS